MICNVVQKNHDLKSDHVGVNDMGVVIVGVSESAFSAITCEGCE